MEVVLTPVNQAHYIPISVIAHLLGDNCLQIPKQWSILKSKQH